MILDRSKAPEFKIPEDFELNPPYQKKLSNGVKLFLTPTKGLAAVKIEVLGKANRSFLGLEEAILPSFTLQMIQEGTKTKSSAEIANFFDFNASEVSPILSFSHEGLSLLTTKKHLKTVFPVFLTLFTDAEFPEEYLTKKKSQRKLNIKLEKEKTASQASQLFRTALFGDNHPYGHEVQENYVDLITRKKLIAYYEKMLWHELEIFVSGDFDQTELAYLEKELGSLPIRTQIKQLDFPQAKTGGNIIESRAEAVQSSIRMGTWSIAKSHPDFFGVSVFNTILGGYFGSRLVKNIREDKGHTYGISSSIAQIGNYNYWVIGADVQKAYAQKVIKEIYHEIDNLIHIPIASDELEVVRNYMIGQMLSGFSSPFDIMDRFQTVHYAGLDFNFFTQKLDYLKIFSAADILKIGKKYFNQRPLIEILVG